LGAFFLIWFGEWLDAPSNLQADCTLPILVVDGEVVVPHGHVFYAIRSLAFGATFASMIACLTAQFVDAHIFHYLKRETQGKRLWLRNNASTLVSQLIDSIALLDIIPFYIGTQYLKKYLKVEKEIPYP
jgi:uncharacterized integral membrane protein (TIGR00697 family)